jgi:hypothetical protein
MTLAAPIFTPPIGDGPAPISTGSTTPLPVADTAARLYDAEVNLHYARQSGIDPWILAAYDHLHLALQAHAHASKLAAGQ